MRPISLCSFTPVFLPTLFQETVQCLQGGPSLPLGTGIFSRLTLSGGVSWAHMLLPRAGRWAENGSSWKIRVCVSTQLLQNNRLLGKKKKKHKKNFTQKTATCFDQGSPSLSHFIAAEVVIFPEATQQVSSRDSTNIEHLQHSRYCIRQGRYCIYPT